MKNRIWRLVVVGVASVAVVGCDRSGEAVTEVGSEKQVVEGTGGAISELQQTRGD